MKICHAKISKHDPMLVDPNCLTVACRIGCARPAVLRPTTVARPLHSWLRVALLPHRICILGIRRRCPAPTPVPPRGRRNRLRGGSRRQADSPSLEPSPPTSLREEPVPVVQVRRGRTAPESASTVICSTFFQRGGDLLTSSSGSALRESSRLPSSFIFCELRRPRSDPVPIRQGSSAAAMSAPPRAAVIGVGAAISRPRALRWILPLQTSTRSRRFQMHRRAAPKARSETTQIGERAWAAAASRGLVTRLPKAMGAALRNKELSRRGRIGGCLSRHR